MGIYPEKRLAHRHEARNMQHPGGVKVVRSDLPLLQQAQQEGVGGVAETPRVKDAERDHLVGAWMGTNLPRRRRPLVSHTQTANLSSWISVREDCLHSDIAAPKL